MRQATNRPAGANNRVERRKAVSKTGIVVPVEGRSKFLCQVSDVSENGALIRIPSGQKMPDQSLFIDMQARTVHQADVAWREAPRFGLKLANRMSLSEVPEELGYLRAIWMEYAAR